MTTIVQTGTGKYEKILERCQDLEPVPTSVAYPCDETSLAGAIDAAAQGLITPILVGPAATIRDLARAKGIDLGGAAIEDARLKGCEIARNQVPRLPSDSLFRQDDYSKAKESAASLGSSASSNPTRSRQIMQRPRLRENPPSSRVPHSGQTAALVASACINPPRVLRKDVAAPRQPRTRSPRCHPLPPAKSRDTSSAAGPHRSATL